MVEEASKIGVKDFIVRSNLTIIRANKKYYDLPEFSKHNIHVVSSMPHWTKGKPIFKEVMVFLTNRSKLCKN
jgi:hypothetical protein